METNASKKKENRTSVMVNVITEKKGMSNICNECYISTEASIHTRRCFMTGEYCSQKTNIQRERKKLYHKRQGGEKEIEVSAFVIMNFSDMSDVVYKWRIRRFIETLNQYLYMDIETNRLYCNVEKNVKHGMKKINKIKVIRSDSDPASNYVICSRICQQMQIADLIIVDVSSQNPNVFYEFGMAVALEKLILPICFSESFYKMQLPQNIQKKDYAIRKDVEHHIGCYPWRKALFEYYGIRYKRNKEDTKNGGQSGTKYLAFEDVAEDVDYGFQDEKYNQFPYDEMLDGMDEKIGKEVYEKLREQYNNATEMDNTLVVYTMEGFLNGDQAGRCIVNFYHSITERMQKEKCFCGERVGVLVQGQSILESDKDAKEERHLLYNVGEIIHIGVNQATYLAAKEKVMSEDVMRIPEYIPNEEKTDGLSKTYRGEITKFVKEYIRNRGMIIYPNHPIYVERVKNMQQEDIFGKLDENCYPLKAFCLYHIMLKTLRYTNEIVVDITDNCLQSLFWLGAAHGAEIYAVTVKHELSERERKIIEGQPQNKNRNVFDVAGLWTAFYYSYDTEGFYHQLVLAQFGIEKHSKIIPSNVSWHGYKRWEYLESEEKEEKSIQINQNKRKKAEIEENSQKKKRLALESYYRRRFWNAMLRYNRLRIYMPERNDKDENGDTMLRVAKWDMDTVSDLTHYLSKRSVIGEYVVVTLPKEHGDDVAEDVNFICVGQPVNPLGERLARYINKKLVRKMEKNRSINLVHEHFESKIQIEECEKKYIWAKGFATMDSDDRKTLYTYLPWPYCVECKKGKEEIVQMDILSDYRKSISVERCPLKNYSLHIEIAQLILWRDDDIEGGKRRHFRVSIIGSLGAATFGLSSLFVDEDQKLNNFYGTNEENDSEMQENTLLYYLQLRVREKISKILIDELKIEIDKILANTDGNKLENGRNRYRNLVLYAIYSYLSTVLYRYFLPFLTDKDIHRIQNDIYIFVNSMKAANHSPFRIYGINDKSFSTLESGQCPLISDEGVIRIIKMIPDKVRIVLHNFKGIEAFYEVRVKHYDSNDQRKKTDNRKVTAIKAVEKEGLNLFVMSS